MTQSEEVAAVCEAATALARAITTLATRVSELEAREARRRQRPAGYPRAGGLHHRDRQGAIPAGARTDAHCPIFDA